MMKPLYKQPLVEAVILASGILCTVVLIHGIQNFIALGGKPVTSQIAQKTNPDLVQVAAGGGCPYSASVSLGQTAGGSEMRERPDRNMKIYNPFSPEYINRLVGTEKPGTAKVPGPVDPKLPVIGTIFGYKPTSVNYYAIQEVAEKKDVTSPWVQYLLGIPTETGTEIRAPQTGYDIGGGKMGLVVYAKDDQIAIHVGRHEYLFASSPESGGYWIYLKGLCVNSEIVSQYNANAASRTQLPELAKGELLGYAIGSEVLIAVRDNGPFTDILAPEWWGSVPAGSAAAAGVPPGGAVVPAGTLPDSVISGKIITNSVETAHPTLFQDFDKKKNVIVAGDSNTANITFILDKFTVEKKAQGEQGAKWLAGQVPSFTANSKFALTLIGVNEVHNGNNDPTKGSLSDFQANLSSIVDKTLEKGIIPVLQTIDDFDKTGDVPTNLTMVNQVIRSVASTKSVPLVVTSDYVDISFMKPDGAHSYHFNETKGAALRNQILRLVNDKLDGVAPAKPAGAAGPETKTVSGKIKLIGKGTYTIDIYQTDSGTNYERTDSDRVVTNLTSMDQVEWSFVPKDAKTCIFARMWTQAGAGVVEKWVDSTITCDLKAGDKDIELTITAPAVLAPAATNHTISGKVDLVGGTLGKKVINVRLEKEDGDFAGYGSKTDTSGGYTITDVPPGKYMLIAKLVFDVGEGLPSKEIAQSDKVAVEISTTDVTKNLSIRLPSEISSNIYIRALKSATENCTAAVVSPYCALSTTFEKRYSDVWVDIKGLASVKVTYQADEVDNSGKTYWLVTINNIKTSEPFKAVDIDYAVVVKGAGSLYISLSPTHFTKIIR